MRPGAPDETMTTLYRWSALIQAWSPAGELLAADIPILSGQVSWDISSRGVPEQATITVPRKSVVDGGPFDWLPAADTTHPLAPYGQTLTIAAIVTSTVTGTQYTTPLARVRVQAWEETDDGAVQVSAVGVLQRAADDELYIPLVPVEGDTLLGQAAELLPAGLTLQVGAGLADRPVAAGTQWSGTRLDALYEIADALPARLRCDPDGVVWLLPPLPDAPETVIARYRDGEPGATVVDAMGASHDMATLISAPRADTRDGVVNSVTVLSQVQSADGATASVVVEAAEGPFAVDVYGRQSESWSSDQITNLDEAEAAGRERLASGLRPARTVAVDIAPDPRVEVDDPVQIARDGATGAGYVLAQTIDLAATDATSLTVSLTGELFDGGSGGDDTGPEGVAA